VVSVSAGRVTVNGTRVLKPVGCLLNLGCQLRFFTLYVAKLKDGPGNRADDSRADSLGAASPVHHFGSAGAKVPTHIKKPHPIEDRMQPAIVRVNALQKAKDGASFE
jgi:hypothetical protein